jgi:uncharacterized protein (TIRG00374 family)
VTQPEQRGARALQLVLGLAITGGLVAWAFRTVDFPLVWTTIRTADVVPMVLAVIVATIPFALRVPRWKLLLRDEVGDELPTAPLWHATAIGFAANNVLPFRAGEVLRVATVSRLAKVPFASALSSVAVERVVDALMVVALLGIGLVAAHLPPDVRIGNGPPIARLATITGVVCIAALVVAIVAAWQRRLAIQILERLLPRSRFSTGLIAFVDRLLAGLSALRDPRRAAPVIGWSVVIWLVNAAGFFIAFKAFGFHVPFAGAVVLQGILMLGIAVPSTPGYALVFEAAIVGALSLYGVPNDAAFAYAVLYHISTFIPITALGAFSAVQSGVRLRAPAT